MILTAIEVHSFGCIDIEIQCSLGSDRRQQALLLSPQQYSLATGCRFEMTSSEILKRCVLATAAGSGYDENSSAVYAWDNTTQMLVKLAVRNQEEVELDGSARPVPFASRSVRRALLTPQVNPGHCFAAVGALKSSLWATAGGKGA